MVTAKKVPVKKTAAKKTMLGKVGAAISGFYDGVSNLVTGGDAKKAPAGAKVRSAATGEYVKSEKALSDPKGTVSEAPRKPLKKAVAKRATAKKAGARRRSK